MAAHIRTQLDKGAGWVDPLTNQSRDDLRTGYLVQCHSVDAATTYSWAIAFLPDSAGPASVSPNDFTGTPSTAVLAPDSISQTVQFTVDWDGSYLIRLIVDAGLGTEDTQYIRARSLTRFGELKLPSAGERRDALGVIPVDADATGWTDDLNQNLLRLTAFIRRTATAGRVLYVDSNRGRDVAETPNDPTNIVRFPGPLTGSLDETGIRARAEGFADFATVNEAIGYVNDYAARGELAPSATNPYIILVKPGFYEENVPFQPFTYVIGETAFENPVHGGVIIRATNTNNHTYTAGAASDYTLLMGLTLENSGGAANDPVLSHVNGMLDLVRCRLEQRKVAAVNESALTIAGPGFDATTTLTDCQVITAATGVASYAISTLGAGPVDLTLTRTYVFGPSGIELDNGAAGTHNAHIQYSTIATSAAPDSGPGILGTPAILEVRGTVIEKVGLFVAANAITLGTYAVATPATLTVDFQDTSIAYGDLSCDNTGVVGASNFITSNLQMLGGTIVFPGAPGVFPTTSSNTLGKSLQYNPSWINPATTAASVPAPIRLTDSNTVQDAIDQLLNILFIPTGAPFFDLDRAYDGWSGLNPPTTGTGLGRLITADAGAVQIEGATPPVSVGDTTLKGGLQVEGIGDFGPIVTDGYGSEINLRPAFGAIGAADGCGPFLSLGRVLVPTNADLTTHRGLPAAVIQAGNPTDWTTPPGDAFAYNMFLRTRNRTETNAGEAGRVVIEGGTIPRGGNAVAGGSVYVQGGSNWNAAGGTAAGNIYVCPGYSLTAASHTGLTYLVDGATATTASLTAANVFAGGVAGNFWVATPHGVESFPVLVADNLAAVITTINTTSLALLASQNPANTLRLDCRMPGPNGDVIFLGDDVAGALNTALGDLTQAGGATLAAGTYVNTVALQCTGAEILSIGTTFPIVLNGATGKLTVPGLIDPIGVILTETPGGADVVPGANKGAVFVSDGSGGLVDNHLYYKNAANAYKDLSSSAGSAVEYTMTRLVAAGMGPWSYNVTATDYFIGVDTTVCTSNYDIVLPLNANCTDGRVLVIKDIGGVAGTVNKGIDIVPDAGGGWTLETGGTPININYMSLMLIADTVNKKWHII